MARETSIKIEIFFLSLFLRFRHTQSSVVFVVGVTLYPSTSCIINHSSESIINCKICTNVSPKKWKLSRAFRASSLNFKKEKKKRSLIISTTFLFKKSSYARKKRGKYFFITCILKKNLRKTIKSRNFCYIVQIVFFFFFWKNLVYLNEINIKMFSVICIIITLSTKFL